MDVAVCGGTVVPVAVSLISVSSWLRRAPRKGRLQAAGRRGLVATPGLRDKPRDWAKGPGACTRSGTGAAFSIP